MSYPLPILRPMKLKMDQVKRSFGLRRVRAAFIRDARSFLSPRRLPDTTALKDIFPAPRLAHSGHAWTRFDTIKKVFQKSRAPKVDFTALRSGLFKFVQVCSGLKNSAGRTRRLSFRPPRLATLHTRCSTLFHAIPR